MASLTRHESTRKVEGGNHMSVDIDVLKRCVKDANRMMLLEGLRNASDVEERLQVMRHMAEEGTLQSLNREGFCDSFNQLLDMIIEDCGENPKMRPVDDWE